AEAVPVLRAALADPEPLVRCHAAWALGRVGTAESSSALSTRLAEEADDSVLDEIRAALAKPARPARRIADPREYSSQASRPAPSRAARSTTARPSRGAWPLQRARPSRNRQSAHPPVPAPPHPPGARPAPGRRTAPPRPATRNGG